MQFIYETFAEKPSLANLRTELSRRDWRTRAGKPWTKPTLHYLLSNPIYIGKLPYNKQAFAAGHEAIVTEALFHKVQSQVRQRQHVDTAIKRPFLLKGLLHCSDCASTMSPHYVQKRHKDGSICRISYYRCTSTMKCNNRACRIKQLNADQAEAFVVDHVCRLSQNEAALDATLDELNRDMRAKVEPLEKEAAQIRQRLTELDAEVDRFVHAVGKGTISVQRLEQEMRRREADKHALSTQLAELERKITGQAATDYNAELVKRNLWQFRNVFKALKPTSKARRCSAF